MNACGLLARSLPVIASASMVLGGGEGALLGDTRRGRSFAFILLPVAPAPGDNGDNRSTFFSCLPARREHAHHRARRKRRARSRMTSPAKIRANRRNGRRSTGRGERVVGRIGRPARRRHLDAAGELDDLGHEQWVAEHRQGEAARSGNSAPPFFPSSRPTWSRGRVRGGRQDKADGETQTIQRGPEGL